MLPVGEVVPEPRGDTTMSRVYWVWVEMLVVQFEDAVKVPDCDVKPHPLTELNVHRVPEPPEITDEIE